MSKPGENNFIKINGANICYDDLGEGEMPLIFIHGFPFDKSMWKPQVDFFKSKRRVIAIDLRGFGKSTHDNQDFSINLFADDLIQFMEGLNIQKAIVCGLSMGGYILLNAISRYPERFSAIILSDTQCIADSPEGREKRFKTISMIEENGLTEFSTGFLKNIFTEQTLISREEVTNKIKSTILSTSSQSVIQTLRALANRSETCAVLGKISIPTLILCGDEDKITTPAQAEFMNTHIKSSTLHLIPGAGHMSNLEQVDLFNSHLDNFLKTQNA